MFIRFDTTHERDRQTHSHRMMAKAATKITDCGRFAKPNHNPEYDLRKFYFTNGVVIVNKWNSVPSYAASAKLLTNI